MVPRNHGFTCLHWMSAAHDFFPGPELFISPSYMVAENKYNKQKLYISAAYF